MHTSLRGVTSQITGAFLRPSEFALLDNDKRYKTLLKAWDANPNFDFYFSDLSSDEIKSSSVSVVKQVLSKKINEANYTVVLVGEEANKQHSDHKEIGCKNWLNYEVVCFV
jgi:hypothetical protein